MAINFPNNPVDGNTYKYNEVTYIYSKNGTDEGYWKVSLPQVSGVATPEEIDAGMNNVKYLTPAGIEQSKYRNGDGLLVTADGGNTARDLSARFADVINVKDFGITGTVSDSTNFKKIQDLIANQGLKNVRLVFPETLTFTSPMTALKLDGLNTFIIDGADAIDTHDYEATGNFVFTRLFDLTNCKNVSLLNMNAVSTLQSVETSGEKKGFTWLRLNGCDVFRYSGSLLRGYRPFEVWNTKVVVADSYAELTRYNAVAQEGCGALDFNLTNVGNRRDFYIYGCTSAKLKVDSTDPYGHAPCILNVENTGEDKFVSNYELDYKIRNSRTYSTGNRQAPTTLQFRTVNDSIGKAIMRNVSIVYDVVGNYGTIIDVTKYGGTGSDGDTQARGYVLDDLNISGRFETALDDNIRLLNWDDGINWHAGDYIQKIVFDKLTVISPSSKNFVLNLDRVIDAVNVEEGIIFQDCYFPQGVVESGTADYGRKVAFKNTNLRDFDGRLGGSGRKTLSKKDWTRQAATPTGTKIQIAKVDNERSQSFIDLKIKAHANPESLGSAWVGAVDGYVSYNSSGTPTIRVAVNKLYENSAGVLVNPVITADTSGAIFLELPEWTSASSATETEAWLDFDLNYAQYSNIDNPYLVGLYSNKFDLPFGAGY